MKITFYFYGTKPSKPGHFFRPETASLFNEYQKRIGAFTDCRSSGIEKDFRGPSAGAQIWLCDFSQNSRTLSSNDLSEKIKQFQTDSVREWWILIGPAGGFKKEDREKIRAHFTWSFGPQTLPHDLAAVVAAEQVYRAFTILKGLPYHLGH